MSTVQQRVVNEIASIGERNAFHLFHLCSRHCNRLNSHFRRERLYKEPSHVRTQEPFNASLGIERAARKKERKVERRAWGDGPNDPSLILRAG